MEAELLLGTRFGAGGRKAETGRERDKRERVGKIDATVNQQFRKA